MVEFDVHQSRDLKPVIIHDASLDRTTSGSGSVESYTAQELSLNHAIPALSELVTLAGADLGLLVEVKSPSKYPGFEGRVLEELKKLPQSADVVIESFDHEFLRRCHQLAPARRYAALLHPLHLTLFPPSFCEAWAPAGDLTLLLFPHLIIIAHLRLKEVWPWFVFRPLSTFLARLFLALGCDGVIVDDPRPFLAK